MRRTALKSCSWVVALLAPACQAGHPPPADARGERATAGTTAGRPAEAGPPRVPSIDVPSVEVEWVEVGPGAYRAPFAPPGAAAVDVPAFRLAARQVTNAEFLAFVRARPEWRRDRAPGLLVDASYLAHWAGPDDLGAAPPGAPVTNVSWFAARAYARSLGLRLPTEAEWEVAAAASGTERDASADPAFRARILEWYARPAPARLPDAGHGAPNAWGARDLHGLVWEWVDDFEAALLDGDLRGSDAPPGLCGAGASGAADASDYATFMRFAMRTAMRPRYTGRNMGFRVAGDLRPPPAPPPVAAPTRGGCCASKAKPAPAAPGVGAAAAAAPPASEPGADERPAGDHSLYALTPRLVGADGGAVRLDVHRGHPLVVSMFYGTCPAVCPMLFEDARALVEALPEAARARVRVLLVSFDAARDDPATLAALHDAHGLDPVRFTLAAAGPDDARELAAALGIRYRRRAADGGFDHTSSLVILDGGGAPAARVDGLRAPIDQAVARLTELAGVTRP
ncbi:MAG: SUMF1/EgtB/PvdO family nonheme iron enzyme [Planctomycetes bacterium]|nr:SUMF1/EgtB/PvdO family nonheme iron enzyme [Planctomycetota bacterium]